MEIKFQKIYAIVLIFIFILTIAIFVNEKNKQLIFGNQNQTESSFLNNDFHNKEELNIDLKTALGQNFIVGIPGFEIDNKTKQILEYIQPAGIVLYTRNYKSPSQFKDLIFQLNKILDKNNASFIMIDEEPGGATRLGLFSKAFSLDMPDWDIINRDIGILKELGINVELAPLADFSFNDDSFIKRRVPVDKKEDLILFNQTFINILHSHKILATLKHFPGMGVFEQDPHKEIPYSNVDSDVFKESVAIFKKGIEDKADFVMTGHAIYKNIDPDNPATLSSEIVEGILVEGLSFKGLVITDDLSDMPLANEKMSHTEVGIKAIKAGHHLIMFSHRLEKTKNIFDSILAEAKKDSGLKDRIKKNYGKIIEFKKNNII